MPLVPLEILPGVYRNGTEYDAKGRWFDTNLVRWRDGRIEPVGGWLKEEDQQLTGKCRALLAWRANDSARYVAAGTHTNLYASQGGQYYDITPEGFNEGRGDSQPGLGWGTSTYGEGVYGGARPSNEVIDATSWSLDNWGEYLVGCSTADGKIYEWNLNLSIGDSVVTNGNFDADSDWTKGAGWTISGGEAAFSGSTIESLTQEITLTEGRSYRLEFTASNAGTDEARVKFTTSTDIIDQAVVDGSNSIDFVADAGTGTLAFEPFAAVASAFEIDSVSIRQLPKAGYIANAPEDNVGIVVTNERYLVALGAGGNKRKVQWSTQEDNTVWTPLATNTAGDLELETNGQIACARRVGNDILIWTDIDVHLMRYLGPPFVYGIERIAVGAGVVGPKAVAVSGNTAIWLSESGFWLFDGSVRPLQCDANNDVTDNINRQQQAKVHGANNSEFGEMWFFYPSENSTENDKYIAYDYRQNHWIVGTLARTAWVDQGALGKPLAADPDGYIYGHETGWTNDNATRVGSVYAETGPIEVGAGDRFAVINRIISDEYDALPSVQATISYKNTPQSTEASKQYVFNQADGYIDTRINARQLKVKLEATRDDGFKFGTLRMDIKQGSGR